MVDEQSGPESDDIHAWQDALMANPPDPAKLEAERARLVELDAKPFMSI